MHYMRQRRHGDPTVTRKPGPKTPQADDAPSQEVLALREEVASLRRTIIALERHAAHKSKRTAATTRGSGRASTADHIRLDAADLSEVADLVNFDNLKFVFAKTMPEIPHWYVKRTPENETDLRRAI